MTALFEMMRRRRRRMMMMMMMRMAADLRMVLMRLVWVSHQALFCWV